RPLGPLLAVAGEATGELRAVVESDALPHEVVAALAGILRARKPTVFVLEDAHWADEATLDVLRLLARRVESLPALGIVTYRDDAGRAVAARVGRRRARRTPRRMPRLRHPDLRLRRRRVSPRARAARARGIDSAQAQGRPAPHGARSARRPAVRHAGSRTSRPPRRRRRRRRRRAALRASRRRAGRLTLLVPRGGGA